MCRKLPFSEVYTRFPLGIKAFGKVPNTVRYLNLILRILKKEENGTNVGKTLFLCEKIKSKSKFYDKITYLNNLVSDTQTVNAY